jgi:hypothetical protein
MNPKPDHSRFENLTFEDFRDLAGDNSLSRYEKIGFPDHYRSGHEENIFDDISSKLNCINRRGSIILDIGSGCSDLPVFMMNQANEQMQTLLLIDSQEMLDLLPAQEGVGDIRKIAAQYPDCPEIFNEFIGKVDGILVYSVFQYIFTQGNIFKFLDRSLELLAPHGRMLIGDIPNSSMRKRFLASASGIEYHMKYMNTQELPIVQYNHIETDVIDDAVLLGMVARARAAGFHAYIVPQASTLPMANRREDLLLIRP